jgi:hypothetical protein
MLQAIREIYMVEQGEIRVHLPTSFWGQQVEVIVLPIPGQEHPARQKKSLRGCLQQYANPELMAKEQEAWQEAMMEKHAPR